MVKPVCESVFCYCISEARCQVLANLANFAYDPINYPWVRQLGVIDVFLTQVSEGSPDLCHFAIAGLCNLALGKFSCCSLLF